MNKFFTEQQQQMLDGKLEPAAVKSRRGSDGKTVSYVEGWYVLDMANEIFGFGNWDLETVSVQREHEPVLVTPESDDRDQRPKRPFTVVTYSAKVRLTVHSADGTRKIVRERSGAHRGFAPTAGEAIENTIKAAETDATKRAFITFGNVFGLALYDKSLKNVGENAPRLTHDRTPPMAPIDEGFDAPPARAPHRPTISERALANAPNARVLNAPARAVPY